MFIWLQAVCCWSESYQTGNGVGPKHNRPDTACPHSACLSIVLSLCLTFICPPAVQSPTLSPSHLFHLLCRASLPAPFLSLSPCQPEKTFTVCSRPPLLPNVFCFHTVDLLVLSAALTVMTWVVVVVTIEKYYSDRSKTELWYKSWHKSYIEEQLIGVGSYKEHQRGSFEFLIVCEFVPHTCITLMFQYFKQFQNCTQCQQSVSTYQH